VIVVGVLVALALDGWWQTREERVRESAYLEAVVAELQSHITELEASLAGNRTAHDALERARQIRRDGQHPDSARAFLSSLVEALTYLVVPTVSTAVYDDLVSTGNIRLIRDDVARGTVLETYSSIEANLERLSIAEESIRPGLNALVSRYLPPNTVSRGTAVFDVRVSEESADTPALRAAAEMIAADDAEYLRLERARQQIARHVEITQAYLQRIQGEVARVQPTRHL
jgi:hypothetical protein